MSKLPCDILGESTFGSAMYCVKIAIAAFCIVAVCGNKCPNCSSSECGPNEERVKGHPRRDRFCRPHVTPRDVLMRRRSCICKRGYVRNSWDECVGVRQCTRCKCRPQKDWNLCASGCPPRCNEPIAQMCRTKCSPGCDCPPGWVVDSRDKTRCVKVQRCSPQCPPHSKYQQCTSTCAPSCVRSATDKKCVTRCYTGSCVCQQGYYELLRNGEKACVTKEECSRFVRPATTIAGRNEIEYIGGGARAPVVVFPPGKSEISGHTPSGTSKTTGGQTTPGGTGCHLPTIHLRLRQGSAGHRLELVGIGREGTTLTGTTANQPPAVSIATQGVPSVNTAGHGSEVVARRQEGVATVVSTPPSLPSILRYPQSTPLPGGVGLHAAGAGLESSTAITAVVPPSPSVFPNAILQPSVGGATISLAGTGLPQGMPGGIGYGPGGAAAITATTPQAAGVVPLPQTVPPLGSEPGHSGVTSAHQPGAFLPGTPTLPTTVGIGGRGLGHSSFDEDLDVGEAQPLPATLEIPPNMQPILPSL
ncbi:uncharacterized protein LOC142564451 [Dermacentor variabilis]|uniref:uncharacterized protein LOC142564451 n=1 Tax=Dermacentor variabilis TaxID=34621 RepID=UPI003F5B345A